MKKGSDGTGEQQAHRAQSGFLGNTFKLLIGNLGAQAITLLTIPIITRIYGPGAYGTLAVFVSVVSLIAAISSFRYNAAILLPESRTDALNIFFLALSLVALVSVVVLAAIVVLEVGQFSFPLEGAPTRFLWWLPLSIFLLGSYAVLSFWATRNGHFGILSISRVAEAATDKGLAIVMGLMLNGGVIGLLVGLVCGQLVSVGSLSVTEIKKEWRTLSTTINWDRVKRLASKYRSFAQYSPWILVNTLTHELPVLMLAAFFESWIVGLYALSNRVLVQPLSALGDAIARSTFHKLAQTHRRGDAVGSLVSELFRYLLTIIVVPMVLLAIIAHEFVVLLFGSEWAGAGDYMQVMWAFFVCVFVFRPLSAVLDIFERQGARLILNLVMLAGSGAGLAMGILQNDPLTAVRGFVIINSLLYSCAFIWILRIAGVPYGTSLGILAKQLVVAGVMAVTAYMLVLVLPAGDVIKITLIGILLGVYVFVVIFSDPRLMSMLLGRWRKNGQQRKTN